MVKQNFVQQKLDNEYSGSIKSMEKFMSCKNTFFYFFLKLFFYYEFFGMLYEVGFVREIKSIFAWETKKEKKKGEDNFWW